MTCVDAAGERHEAELAGRASVFAGPTDVAYVPAGSAADRHRHAGAARIAICAARGRPARRAAPFRHLAVDEVPVELRGAGSCSREVRNFGTPAVLEADSIIACEVLTPAGNWCSYPPHKHDEDRDGRRDRARGDLLLRDPGRGRRPARDRRRPGRLPAGLRHRRAADRRARRGAHRRRRARAARLARAVDGRTRLRPVLPQRDGRPRRRAGLADLRRPSHGWVRDTLGRPGRRPPTAVRRHRDDATRPIRLTVAQATVAFLAAQWSERDGERQKLFAGCFGIFGHGNVAGIGQALLQHETGARRGQEPGLPYVLARNEQAMVHTSVAYARQKDRLQTWACTASVGPGSTNMLTGAALATINRLPVLLLPSGTFATRRAGPGAAGARGAVRRRTSPSTTRSARCRASSTGCSRPEQLPSALLGAMRVLTDPVETGAVTIALPQDVQAEAYDWPVELFADRTWHVAAPAARGRSHRRRRRAHPRRASAR